MPSGVSPCPSLTWRVGEHVVGPRDQRQQVGAEELRLGEFVQPARRLAVGAGRGCGARLGRVRHHRPVGRRRHPQPVARLDVRLVEARQHAMRLVRLELRVEVLGAVLRVAELMQPHAAVVVRVAIHHPHDVPLAQQRPGQLQPVARPAHPIRAQRVGVVDVQPHDLLARAVQEDPGRRVAVLEADRDVALVVRVAGAQRERQVVLDPVDHGRAIGGLVLRENVRTGSVVVSDHRALNVVVVCPCLGEHRVYRRPRPRSAVRAAASDPRAAPPRTPARLAAPSRRGSAAPRSAGRRAGPRRSARPARWRPGAR